MSCELVFFFCAVSRCHKCTGIGRASSMLPLLAAMTVPTTKAPCRDRFLEPFASSSIWNTAVGSSAAFSPCNLFATDARKPTQFHNDQECVQRRFSLSLSLLSLFDLSGLTSPRPRTHHHTHGDPSSSVSSLRRAKMIRSRTGLIKAIGVRTTTAQCKARELS